MRKRLTWLLVILGLLLGARALWYQSLWAQAGSWQQTAPGIEVITLSRQRVSGKLQIIAVRANPNRCTIRMVDMHKGEANCGSLAPDAFRGVGASINASFFAEDLTPLGLLIVDGKKVRPHHPTGAWGYFLIRNGKPSMMKATGKVPSGVTQAVQSKPRLVVEGTLQKFKQQPAAPRSAVGIDAAGRVILAASDGPLTLEEWASCLRDDLGCPNALNLDGGPSTQLEVRGRINRSVPGGWPVPTFITVTPREESK